MKLMSGKTRPDAPPAMAGFLLAESAPPGLDQGDQDRAFGGYSLKSPPCTTKTSLFKEFYDNKSRYY